MILNTKIWPQMQVDKASEKSLRITALDTEEQGVKVFLIAVRLQFTTTDYSRKGTAVLV